MFSNFVVHNNLGHNILMATKFHMCMWKKSTNNLSTCAMIPISAIALILFVFIVDYEDKALEKPLKLVLKVGGTEVTELSGSGHDSSYYDDRSDHERERHKEKKKKKKKKSEKDKDKYVDDEERRRRKVS